MAPQFSVSESTSNRVNTRLREMFCAMYAQEVSFPAGEQLNELGIHFFGHQIIGIVDNSEQSTARPSEKQDQEIMYSGKQCDFTFTKLACVSPRGKCLYLSPSYAGAKNDLNVYQLPENCIQRKINDEQFVMFDRGYNGVQHNGKGLLAIRHAREDWEKAFNRAFNSIRIVVENFFSRVKHWAVCAFKFRFV